jgi:hypothetical protein
MAMQTVKLLSYDDGGDAIDFLRRQHREIDQLLGALAEASPDDRGDILVEAGDLLAVHMAVEERIFYPGLTPEASDGEHRSFVVLAVEDHFDVKRALGELLQTAVDDGAFAAMTSLLRERIRTHASAEERLFPRIRRRLSRTRLRRLEYEMRVLEFEIRTDAEPRHLFVEDGVFTASA